MKYVNVLTASVSRLCALLFASALILTQQVRAGDGWELLASNDHRAAREAFEQRLESDSLDQSSLKGMLILSEMHGDVLEFDSYLTRLIAHYWEEPLYHIFEDDYEGSDTLIDSSPMSQAAKVGARYSLGWERYRYYDVEGADSIFRTLVPENRWSLIGPFKNLDGSGYLVRYPVEDGSFDSKAVYRDDRGIDLRWIRPAYTTKSGIVDFSDHLVTRNDGVCYANTFLHMPTGGRVQLRLARSAPITLWVDDDQVFTSRERIGFHFDGEIIELDLKEGWHRILVKLAPYYGLPNSYDILELRGSASYDRFGQSRFALRVTDTDGASLPDVKSYSYDERYAPARHSATVTGLGYLEHYRSKVEGDPADLFACYALCRAFMETGRSEEGEEYFLNLVRAGHDNVVMRWLLARLYAMNGKIEKVYSTLEKLDEERTPVFGLLYEKFEQIDMDSQEKQYLEALGNLYELAPSNYAVISTYVEYYSRKDMNTEKDAFIDEVVADWPYYEDRLERSRSDYKRRSEVDERTPGDITDSLLTGLETKYDAYDYSKVIEYYVSKEEFEKVIELYDRMINHFPYWISPQRDKAKYLVEEKKYDEAIKTYLTILTITPYNVGAYEDIGDAYRDKGEPEKALEFYRKAVAVAYDDLATQRGWDENSLAEKIDNLSKASSARGYFNSVSFGDVLAADDWREEYADEESVILLYTKEQLIDTVGRIRSWHKMMVAILTEAGADWWTEYDFGFMGQISTVKVLKASGGEVVPDRRGGYVVFKDLKAGDIIQMEGLVEESDDGMFDGEYFDITHLSFGASVHRAKIEVLAPKGRYIGYSYHNLKDRAVKTSRDGFDSYVWEYSGLDRTPFEDAMLDSDDADQVMFLSTMRDWSKVVEWYDQKTYRRCEAPYDVREALDSVVSPGMTKEQQVEAVYNYITRKINYSYVPFFQSAYTPKFPSLTLSASIGDCKDVATLMITMLRELGVEAHFALVKTNYLNHQKFMPSPWFDHVIVAADLDGRLKFMDLTTNFYPHYALPEGDCGAWALLIRDGEKELIQLPMDQIDPEKNLIEIDVEARLDTGRQIALDVHARHRGLAGGSIREGLVQLNKDEMKNYILELMGKGTFQDLRLHDYTFNKQFELSVPLESTYRFTGSRFSDKVSNLYIFRIPYMLGLRPSQALQTTTRISRLDVERLCEAAPSRQTVTIRFPDGYQLTELPANIDVKNEFGTYTVNYSQVENGLKVEKYQQFNSAWIEPEQFEEFREFYLRILDLDEARYAIMRQKS